MKQPFDPILKAAMHEISRVFEKYDIGGFVNLASPTHGEYGLFIEPSWSAARFIKDSEGKTKAIHFKLRKGEYEKASQTGHLLLSTMDMCGMVALQMGDLKKQLEQVTKVEHIPAYLNQTNMEDDDET